MTIRLALAGTEALLGDLDSALASVRSVTRYCQTMGCMPATREYARERRVFFEALIAVRADWNPGVRWRSEVTMLPALLPLLAPIAPEAVTRAFEEPGSAERREEALAEVAHIQRHTCTSRQEVCARIAMLMAAVARDRWRAALEAHDATACADCAPPGPPPLLTNALGLELLVQESGFDHPALSFDLARNFLDLDQPDVGLPILEALAAEPDSLYAPAARALLAGEALRDAAHP